MGKCANISLYMKRLLVIYDFAVCMVSVFRRVSLRQLSETAQFRYGTLTTGLSAPSSRTRLTSTGSWSFPHQALAPVLRLQVAGLSAPSSRTRLASTGSWSLRTKLSHPFYVYRQLVFPHQALHPSYGYRQLVYPHQALHPSYGYRQLVSPHQAVVPVLHLQVAGLSAPSCRTRLTSTGSWSLRTKLSHPSYFYRQLVSSHQAVAPVLY